MTPPKHPTLLELDVRNAKMKLDDAPGKEDPTRPLTTVVGSRAEEREKTKAEIYRQSSEAMANYPSAPDHDPVNHPSHYTRYQGLEIIDLTEQMNFNLGNAVKYIARAGWKNPDKTVEDLEKAIWYTKREIERIQKRP